MKLKNKIKNMLSLILIVTITFSFSINTFATNITANSVLANVIQVIDADTINVVLPSGETAFVRLKGIKSQGLDDGFAYLNNELLGKTVNLVKDGTSYNGRKLNYMLVFHQGKNMSEEMLLQGYAVIDNTQNKATSYNSLVTAQNTAQDDLNGIWKYNSNTYSSITGHGGDNPISLDDKININTATKSQLVNILSGVTNNLAHKIISYREKNPFSNPQEIKFVDGFTNNLYIKNKPIMNVSTNINTANSFELKTLDNLSDVHISKILDERYNSNFTSIKQIYNIVGRNIFDNIEHFISITSTNDIDVSVERYRANISLSSKRYLIDAGIHYYSADDIISNRKNGYTYKTLMELTKLDNKRISENDIHQLDDNFNTKIDINTNNMQELLSIFYTEDAVSISDKTFNNISELEKIVGSSTYNKVKNIVYVDKNINEYINLNTATKTQMTNIGINPNDARIIETKRPITSANYLPINVSNIDNKISLYTNINTASEIELKSLNNGISSTIISKIIDYRKDNNFSSSQEIEKFFIDNNALSSYKKIKQYLVVK